MLSESIRSAEIRAFDRINFKPWEAMSRLPMIQQSEISECGLACLAMVSSYFGLRMDISGIRLRLGAAQDGMNLKQLIVQANRIGLSPRVVKAGMGALRDLKAPCILHWDMNHFVVLKKAGRRKLIIHDPAIGVVKMTYEEASVHFTGFVIELEPNQDFVAKDERKIPTLASIIGHTRGMYSAIAHIFVLALLLQIIALASPAAMQWMIDNAFGSADNSLIVTVVVGLALLMLINLTVGLIRTWMVTYLSASLGLQWSSRVLMHLLHLPVDFFERRHLGDVLSRFGSVSAIQRTVTTGLIEGVLDGLMSVATLIMIWIYSPKLALTAIAALVLLTLIQVLSFQAVKINAREGMVADARASTNLMESVRGIRSIKLYGCANERRSVWQNLTVEAINAKIKGQWLGLAIETAGSLISGTQRIIAIYLAATLIYQGQFTVGMLFAYLSYQDQFIGRAGNLVGYFFELRMLRLHFERLSDIVLTKTEGLPLIDDDFDENGLQSTSTPGDIADMPDGPVSVQFKNVSFRYSEFADNVLDYLSFSSEGSRCTVITGKSGVGKTTVAKMILGIYKPASGRIIVNGHPIEKIGIEQHRSTIASVLQGDPLFAGSIRENISFFDTQADPEWVEQCAKIACVHDDIQRMIMGYHTAVGDMGSTLSAGQKQRILIARALYRKPKILLLDEATSDLDVATEEQINRNLAELDLHRIYIAHRPQTIKYGDRVIHIEGGRTA